MKKKLIEVALPLDAINVASAKEKSIRHGHPSTLHLWWSRKPLASARAVIFAQMVDDPSAYVDVLRADPKLHRKAESVLRSRLKLWEEARALSEKAKATGLSVPEPGPTPTLDDTLADNERQRLFRILENLVQWENTTNETVLQAARDEIWQSWRRACAENAGHSRAKELFDRKRLPAFHDPFAGGGGLPLEAQRLGLEAHAGDLNPVAVLINKAMIEIPPKFAGRPPVNPDTRRDKALFEKKWERAGGLGVDVRYYGKWIRDEAERRIGQFFPRVEVTTEMASGRKDLAPLIGQRLSVIAWFWARTVKSPNPAYAQMEVPLASTFMLSTKAGKEAYVEPVIEGGVCRFAVKVGAPRDIESARRGTKLARGANFRCLLTGDPIPESYVKAEMLAGRSGFRLMAMVVEGPKGRHYLSPTVDHECLASRVVPSYMPEQEIGYDPHSGATWCVLYGLRKFGDLFTKRQLVAMTTFSDLVVEARARIRQDAIAAGLPDDDMPLRDGGAGATAYAEALEVYLALAVDRMANTVCSIARWTPERQQTVTVFARQAIPMTWEFPEVNPFAGAAGDYQVSVDGVIKGISSTTDPPGFAEQADAATQNTSQDKVVSTDPPYYDNIGYADLSDFFYVWLRRSLKLVFPGLFSTLAVPKVEELVATPSRHGSKNKADTFFLDGMTRAMRRLAERAHPAFPVTIYYAFKQSETESTAGTTSTGWETFLGAVIRAGFAVTGTWPMRTELSNRMLGAGNNSLASSIVLVCRPRATSAASATRRQFVVALKAELPQALAHLQAGNIAPVDLAQAAIGPGMAVFTRYCKVFDAEGNAITVREALALINQTLDEALAEQEGDFDADSRWAVTWFEQSGFDDGEFGVAEQLSKSKNTSVTGMVEAGILESKRGRVRLLRPTELPADWDPDTDPRLTAWEMVHHLIRVLESGGESAASALAARLGTRAEVARELCYRLYTVCERKKRAAEALAYNALVQSWPEITRLAREGVQQQGALFTETED